MTTSSTALREQIEQDLWKLTGWRAHQPAVDRLLAGDVCGGEGHTPCCRPIPAPSPGGVSSVARLEDVDPAEVERLREQVRDQVRTEVAAGACVPPGRKVGDLALDSTGGVWRFLGVPVAAPAGGVGGREVVREPVARAVVDQVGVGGVRRCRRCGVDKPLVEGFHKDAKNREGRKTVCKVCEAARKRADGGRKP